MKSYWGFIKGDNYDLGCTGGSVTVIDKEGKEVAVFKGLSHANEAAFVPNRNAFIVKSADGYVCAYSLDEMKLIKKFRFSNRSGQDYGFCFSPDGTVFYIIDNYNGLNTRIVTFETENFTQTGDILTEEKDKFLTRLECFRGHIMALGYMRNFGVASCGFVGFIEDGKLTSVKKVSITDFYYADRFKTLEALGFTEKAVKWLPLPEDRDITEFSLMDLL